MAYWSPNSLDAALNYIKSNANEFHVCSDEPTTYEEATATYSLGSKTSPEITGPGARAPDGRKCTISAFSDGVVSGAGEVSYWALVNTSEGDEELLAVGSVTPKNVTTGSPFTWAATDFWLPDL